MARDRFPEDQDQVVTTEVPREQLFRIYAVEPHGWSTVLIEDQNSRIYLCSTTAAALTEVAKADAESLLNSRAYRRWHGSTTWTPLSQLPLVAATFSRPGVDLAAGSEGSSI